MSKPLYNNISTLLSSWVKLSMAKWLMAACLAFALPVLASADDEITRPENLDNKLTSQEIADGWELLFDGKTTNGWHTLGEPDNRVFKAWKARRDGTLRFKKTNPFHWFFWICCQRDPHAGGGNITTNDRTFRNFHVKVDWNVSKNANSGIIMFGDEEYYKKHRGPLESYSHAGLESQITDDVNVKVDIFNEALTGDLVGLNTVLMRVPDSVNKKLNPIGQWNTSEVIVTQDRYVDVILNGQKVLTGIDLNNLKSRRLAASGIMLQDHGSDLIKFKNIKIKRM